MTNRNNTGGEVIPIPIHELANIVPRASAFEQAELNKDIADNGFDTSIGYMSTYKGKLIDGRNRQEACLRAGLDPRDYVQDLGDITIEEARYKAKRFNRRRNLTTTQKVIYAWNQTQLPKDEGKLTQVVAADEFKVGVSGLKHVGTINKYTKLLENTNLSTSIYKVVKVSDGSYSKAISPSLVLDTLSNDHFIKIGDKSASNSVKTIAKALKELHESIEVVEHTAIAAWDADAFITTEKGKEWYRGAVITDNLKEDAISARMHLAELANFKFSSSIYFESEEALEKYIKEVVGCNLHESYA